MAFAPLGRNALTGTDTKALGIKRGEIDEGPTASTERSSVLPSTMILFAE